MSKLNPLLLPTPIMSSLPVWCIFLDFLILYWKNVAFLIDFYPWTFILGHDRNKRPVYLHDIFPSREEVAEFERKNVLRDMFIDVYENITKGSQQWQLLQVKQSINYDWDPKSTYIRRPPFFDNMVGIVFSPLFYLAISK